MKKITEEEYERINAFIRKHYVEYYDLQCELADHLANGIEALWEQNPQLSFDDALQQEFKKFGVFGFMQVVEQRQAALYKKYTRLLWHYAKDFLRLPKIFLSIGLVVGMYTVVSHSPVAYSAMLLLLILLSAIMLTGMYRGYRKRVKQTGKRWLLEDLIYRGGGMGALLVLPYQLADFVFDDEVLPAYASVVLAVWFVAVALYQYIILYVIPSKAKEHLMATYPEYKMEISG